MFHKEKAGKSIEQIFDEAQLEIQDEEVYYDEVRKYIKEEDTKDIAEMEQQIHDFHRLYKKHVFDDDQTICRQYHEMIVNLKNRIKEMKSGKTK